MTVQPITDVDVPASTLPRADTDPALVKHLGGDSARSYEVLRDYRWLCIGKKAFGDLNNMISHGLAIA